MEQRWTRQDEIEHRRKARAYTDAMWGRTARKSVGASVFKWILLIGLVALFLWGVATTVHANHDGIAVLQDKWPVAMATCSLTKKGLMAKNGQSKKPCMLFDAADDDSRFWTAIMDDKREILYIIESVIKSKKQRVVWRKGTRS